ncbi:hypothetical protein [Bradyrhizobium lablabi]|uniref:hypothetical protein n=1 Tax=Bradyrhizobium lablabi TaxID=722472 RepID=UPI001BAD5C7C|nr:hypothetical protein [Bradyrhizobium lablabi]MBR0696274.1 hypothetical protein [Bradyrhizobium lablabi]
MQKFIEELDSGERRVANNWTLVSFSLYGSILAGLVLHAAAGQTRGAGVTATAVSASASLAQAER